MNMSVSALDRNVVTNEQVILPKCVLKHLKHYAEENQFNESCVISQALSNCCSVYLDILSGVKYSFVSKDGSIEHCLRNELDLYVRSLSGAHVLYDLSGLAVEELGLTKNMIKRQSAAKGKDLSSVESADLFQDAFKSSIILYFISQNLKSNEFVLHKN